MPLPNVLVCTMLFLGYTGLLPTDWEEDFPTQLTQCSPEVCGMAFSLPRLLCKQLFIIIHYLSSACSRWGWTNIKSTHWQSQADAVSLNCWMQLLRNFLFSLWRYSAAPPTADSKEILNLSAKQLSTSSQLENLSANGNAWVEPAAHHLKHFHCRNLWQRRKFSFLISLKNITIIVPLADFRDLFQLFQWFSGGLFFFFLCFFSVRQWWTPASADKKLG